MTQIQQARIRSFRGIRDLTVDFTGQLTLLVGRNGSGKTSTLTALTLLNDAFFEEYKNGATTDPFDRIFRDRVHPRALANRTTGQPLSIGYAIGTEAWLLEYKPVSQHGSLRDAYVFSKGPVAGLAQDPFTAHLAHSTESNSDSNRTWEFFRSRPRHVKTALYRLQGAMLSEPSASEDPELEASGFGLPSVLSYLAGTDRKTLAAIELDLGKVVPGVIGIRTPPSSFTANQKSYVGHRLEIEFDKIGVLPAEQVSEGTLIALALLTAIHSKQGPNVLLLDDLEQGLHPTAQVTLMECIQTILKLRPDLQIIATTHSPYLLDLVSAESVILFKRDAEQVCTAKKLSSHPDYGEWKGTLRTGEFWDSVGEDWL